MNDNLLHKNTLVCVHLPGNHSGHSVQVYKKLKKNAPQELESTS